MDGVKIPIEYIAIHVDNTTYQRSPHGFDTQICAWSELLGVTSVNAGCNLLR